MSASDPFLPEPAERAAGLEAETEVEDVEADEQPDVLPGAAEGHAAEEVDAAGRAAEPDHFRTPRAGDRLSADALEDELD